MQALRVYDSCYLPFAVEDRVQDNSDSITKAIRNTEGLLPIFMIPILSRGVRHDSESRQRL